MDDDGLFNLFRATNPKSARIHVRRPGARSRGIGFVEYDNQTAQQNAINAMNGFMVEDGPDRPARKIEVFVSETRVPIAQNNAPQQQ